MPRPISHPPRCLIMPLLWRRSQHQRYLCPHHTTHTSNSPPYMQKPNLILNVDGVIATCFVDLLRYSGAFTRLALLVACYSLVLLFLLPISSEEAQEYIEIGTLNGLFVLGRTIGNIGEPSTHTHTKHLIALYFSSSPGHYLDQKRLKQGLYRHPWDDIAYLQPDSNAA